MTKQCTCPEGIGGVPGVVGKLNLYACPIGPVGWRMDVKARFFPLVVVKIEAEVEILILLPG